jgi:hypothetical protein
MISASKEATEPKVSRGYHLESVVVSAITCSTVSEYLCHTWPRICSICRNHNPVLSQFLTYRRVWKKSSKMSNTCGAQELLTLPVLLRLLTDFVCLYTYEFWLSLCKIVRSSVILLIPLFIVVFSQTIVYPFVLFHLTIVLSFLRLTDFD